MKAEMIEKMTDDMCGENQFPELFKSYPAEGSSLLAKRPDLEISGGESMKNFGNKA